MQCARRVGWSTHAQTPVRPVRGRCYSSTIRVSFSVLHDPGLFIHISGTSEREHPCRGKTHRGTCCSARFVGKRRRKSSGSLPDRRFTSAMNVSTCVTRFCSRRGSPNLGRRRSEERRVGRV